MYICCLIDCFEFSGLIGTVYLFSLGCLFSLSACLLFVMFCGIFYAYGFGGCILLIALFIWIVLYVWYLIVLVFDTLCLNVAFNYCV